MVEMEVVEEEKVVEIEEEVDVEEEEEEKITFQIGGGECGLFVDS